MSEASDFVNAIHERVGELLTDQVIAAAIERGAYKENGLSLGKWIAQTVIDSVDAVNSMPLPRDLCGDSKQVMSSEDPHQQDSQSRQPVRHGRQLRLVVIEVPENLGDEEIEAVRSAAQLIAEQIR